MSKDLHPLDRRQALLGGLSILGGAAVLSSLGSCESRSPAPRADSSSGAAGGSKLDERILVLVELYGGNDGISTVVPYENGAYYDARPQTHVKGEEVLAFEKGLGFHPALSSFQRQYRQGHLAVVQGVGYPRPVYSHFKSFEIWHTAREEGRASGDGWVGRLREAAWGANPRSDLVVHVGTHIPFSLHSSKHEMVVFETPENFVWVGDERDLQTYGQASGSANGAAPPAGGSAAMLDHLRGTLRDAQATSPRILSTAATYKPRVEYPDDPFARSMRVIASMINAGFDTRVYSVALGNFDTHGPEQVEKHQSLLATLDAGVGSFLEDLQGTPNAGKTLVMCYSEFGRRVRENYSRGTDHGAAGPLFLFGPSVRGGLYGEEPSLTKLDQDGNLVYNTDFRRVYSSVLQGWFGVENGRVLPEAYESLPVFA
jgi:uncharacterized protein (DUF1501 family)